MLYGVQGVGKSTWANVKGAIFLPTEEGLNNIDCESFPLAKTLGEVKQRVRQLIDEDHNYRLLCIDTLDWLEPMIWRTVCEQQSKAKIEDIGFGKGYVYACDLWRDLLAGLDKLRAARGMHIVLLAHAKVELFADPRTNDYQRYTPHLHKLAAAVVQEWCDEVFFASFRVYTSKSETDRTAKGAGAGERVIYTEERPYALAKNRLSLPAELNMSFGEYASYFMKG
jgi:hypothetical protein